MNSIKYILILLVIIFAISLLVLWFKTFIVGQYYVAAPFFLTALGCLMPIGVLIGGYKLVKLIKKSDITI